MRNAFFVGRVAILFVHFEVLQRATMSQQTARYGKTYISIGYARNERTLQTVYIQAAIWSHNSLNTNLIFNNLKLGYVISNTMLHIVCRHVILFQSVSTDVSKSQVRPQKAARSRPSWHCGTSQPIS